MSKLLTFFNRSKPISQPTPEPVPEFNTEADPKFEDDGEWSENEFDEEYVNWEEDEPEAAHNDEEEDENYCQPDGMKQNRPVPKPLGEIDQRPVPPRFGRNDQPTPPNKHLPAIPQQRLAQQIPANRKPVPAQPVKIQTPAPCDSDEDGEDYEIVDDRHLPPHKPPAKVLAKSNPPTPPPFEEDEEDYEVPDAQKPDPKPLTANVGRSLPKLPDIPVNTRATNPSPRRPSLPTPVATSPFLAKLQTRELPPLPPARENEAPAAKDELIYEDDLTFEDKKQNENNRRPLPLPNPTPTPVTSPPGRNNQNAPSLSSRPLPAAPVLNNQESVDDDIEYEHPDDITPPPNRSFLHSQIAQRACQSVKTAKPKPPIPSSVPKPSPDVNNPTEVKKPWQRNARPVPTPVPETSLPSTTSESIEPPAPDTRTQLKRDDSGKSTPAWKQATNPGLQKPPNATKPSNITKIIPPKANGNGSELPEKGRAISKKLNDNPFLKADNVDDAESPTERKIPMVPLAVARPVPPIGAKIVPQPGLVDRNTSKPTNQGRFNNTKNNLSETKNSPVTSKGTKTEVQITALSSNNGSSTSLDSLASNGSATRLLTLPEPSKTSPNDRPSESDSVSVKKNDRKLNPSNSDKRSVSPMPPDKRPLPGVPAATEVESMYSFGWYYPNADRPVSESKLKAVNEDGCFLIRKSQRGGVNNPYTLTLLYRSSIFNLHIRKRTDQKFALGTEKPDEHVFNSVPELVTFHQNNSIELIGDSRKNIPTGKVTLNMWPKN